MKNLEKRTFPMELRVTRDNGAPVLDGHIAVFNERSVDLGGFREKIQPGAFAETIATHDIMALWNHDGDLVLGRNKSGTLELSEDEVGLAFKNTPPDTTWFRDRLVSLERKDVTGCSFGFYTEDDEWSTEADGSHIRILKKCTLIEVSPGVTFPAYPQTDVALRSMQLWKERAAGAPPEGFPNPGQLAAAVVQMESRKRMLHLKERELAS